MLNIQIFWLYNLEFFIFAAGLAGLVLNQKNIIVNILSLELSLLGVNLVFSTASLLIDDIVGNIFVIFILAVAAAETSIGLALTAAFYRLGNAIEICSILSRKLIVNIFKKYVRSKKVRLTFSKNFRK